MSFIACAAMAGLLPLGPWAGTAVAAKPVPYKVVDAERNVSDVANETTTYGASWNGNGHRHDTLQAPDPELPPLPYALTPGKKNTVQVTTDVLMDGDETLINAEGQKEECSGTWEEESEDTFTVKVSADGKRATWEMITDIASRNCGFLYDQFPDPFKVKGSVNGQIGDDRVVLKVGGNKQETEQTSIYTITQNVKWDGRVVLKRLKQQSPGPTPFP